MQKVVIFLVVAIAVFLFGKSCKYIDNSPTVVTHTDTVYKQKTFTKYIKGDKIPYKVISESIRIDTIRYSIHDTITMVKDYLTVKVYTDTFAIDSSKFTIIDTISQNMIQGRRFLADIKEKTIIITNDIYHKNKNAFYLGILGDLRTFDNKVGLGVGIGFKTAKNSLITFVATTNQYSVGYYFKLY
jgi:hypothetical protein